MASNEKKSASGKSELPANSLKKKPLVYVGTIIFMGLSIVAFIWVPSARKGGKFGGPISFGSYAGKPIEYSADNYIVQEAEQLDRYYSQQFGQGDMSEQMQQYKNQLVWSSAFQQTVVQFGKLHEAERSGNLVSESRIDDYIMSMPGFQENGVFSVKLYDSMGEARKASLRKDIAQQLQVQEYESDLTGIPTPKAEKDFLTAMDTPRRSFTAVSIPFSAYPDSEVSAYAAANSSLFRKATFSFVRADDKNKAILAKLAKELSSGKKTLDEADKASGESYTVVQKASKQYWEIKAMFSKEDDAKAVFGLAAGAWSPLLRDADGQWIAFQCVEAAADTDLSTPDAIAAVRSFINDKERGVMESWATKRAQDFSAKAASNFASACKEFSLSSKAIAPFPLNFGGNQLLGTIDSKEMAELSSAANDADFFQALFSLKQGEISKPLVLGDSVAVFRLDAESQATAPAPSVASGYYLASYLDNAMGSFFLKSKLLKDNFQETYQATFSSKTATQQ